MKLNLSGKSKKFYFPSISLIILTCFLMACHQNPKAEMSPPAFNAAADGADSVKPKITQAMVDNKKDPSCGMPVSAGIADTVHYKGKVYGFCSDECKQQFLKNPDSLAKYTVMK